MKSGESVDSIHVVVSLFGCIENAATTTHLSSTTKNCHRMTFLSKPQGNKTFTGATTTTSIQFNEMSVSRGSLWSEAKGNQSPPFHLLLFIFWTLRSFFGIAVVELHMRSFEFHHACTIPPPQCQRKYAASKDK